MKKFNILTHGAPFFMIRTLAAHREEAISFQKRLENDKITYTQVNILFF